MAERIVNDMARYIRERFPDKKQSIDRLMAEDPGFLALCDDYDVCVNALHYWSKSGEPEAEIRVNEYRTLIRELEEEVTEILAMRKPRRLD